jgi:hypothetical protein
VTVVFPDRPSASYPGRASVVALLFSVIAAPVAFLGWLTGALPWFTALASCKPSATPPSTAGELL